MKLNTKNEIEGEPKLNYQQRRGYPSIHENSMEVSITLIKYFNYMGD